MCSFFRMQAKNYSNILKQAYKNPIFCDTLRTAKGYKLVCHSRIYKGACISIKY